MSLSSHHLDISRISSPVLQGEGPNIEVERVHATPLSPAIGAIVSGVNLAQSLTAKTESRLRELLLRHQVLFFRNQNITPRQQRNFAQRFGPLHQHPIYPTVADVPEIIVLDTEQNDLKDNALWHTDVTFSQTPPLGAVLAARHLPPSGGDTLWASATAAYDALSDGMKLRLEHLTALHDFTHSFPLSRFGRTEAEKQKWLRTREQQPPVEHPVIRIHPETNKRAIFVNEGFTTEVCGLEIEESAALLRFLFQHLSKPEFSVRWTWREGDVAFWDNRATQHYAVDDYRPHRRIMHRATILGDRPFGPAITQQQKH
ncbi:taurine dioxygenase [Acetobacter pasteurianus]|uniref:Alpha-ketoglutarate-dependent taurine dioxygenase n=2 Tax=Acetobacter pasteurianus TaxID=438 RepID=C7JHR3_ACEP3|nr:taurine dioxygenase [Acetobacter pasteurianus]ASC06982.1 Taurine dioxygenase [Acetobacter pasteurianus subsp. pasteurianus]BAH99517.1 alpha-ketoglutarate-dependent taurine dioxygenase [Acetobacter pasteurianus IFO 3283-01]BAI02570.1 alpha-ketoglutarate-dependent taurine dioxygenase [Acetobacter pasteurianus IFO 3283-03]BAI05616.1 alpha-ketoglutarate-dependent taurine dioxygenase [Acetobacter pasteurianus IFO 3283-07]BAI08665.1 alpha-ketoglutarate-dependent taurine dioxygenase [Acetobacter p